MLMSVPGEVTAVISLLPVITLQVLTTVHVLLDMMATGKVVQVCGTVTKILNYSTDLAKNPQ